ncbi:unnamed protein product [Adineta steineri]|uniref:Uncharacterized protein n=1 Tax=Adineta steineri TaxID=433720 RepID=A0A814TXW3_9BILA|nr:unnamed protein product [Adineta steineri]CAF3639409.1 unnamed protein product [Adineta steineri]
MKLFRNLLSKHRSNKKKSSSSSPVNIKSNNLIQSSVSSCCEQTLNLLDKHTKCTCHYFNFNENCLAKNLHTKLISIDPSTCSTLSSRLSINIIPSLEYLSNVQYILTVADFCFWYDVRSALLDIIDRIVTMNETQSYLTEKISPTIVKLHIPQINTVYRKIRRPKTSIAIQTSHDYDQRRNAKVQANTVTIFSLQKPNLSSSKLFLN